MNFFRSQRLRYTRARIAASAVATVALLAQLGSVAHLAAVKHVACEHGELVEVASAPRAIAAPAQRAASIAADDEQAHGHDHCAIAMLRRERASSESRVAAPAPQTEDRTTLHSTERAAPAPAIAILDLAPKNSPPAA